MVNVSKQLTVVSVNMNSMELVITCVQVGFISLKINARLAPLNVYHVQIVLTVMNARTILLYMKICVILNALKVQ